MRRQGENPNFVEVAERIGSVLAGKQRGGRCGGDLRQENPGTQKNAGEEEIRSGKVAEECPGWNDIARSTEPESLAEPGEGFGVARIKEPS